MTLTFWRCNAISVTTIGTFCVTNTRYLKHDTATFHNYDVLIPTTI